MLQVYSYNMNEPTEDELDPRIQVELELLNSTTDEINKLESEYDVNYCYFICRS